MYLNCDLITINCMYIYYPSKKIIFLIYFLINTIFIFSRVIKYLSVYHFTHLLKSTTHDREREKPTFCTSLSRLPTPGNVCFILQSHCSQNRTGKRSPWHAINQLLGVQAEVAVGTLLFLLCLKWVQASVAAGTLLFSLGLLLLFPA